VLRVLVEGHPIGGDAPLTVWEMLGFVRRREQGARDMRRMSASEGDAMAPSLAG